ncbi:peptidoglycan DD-metalloendopeptidase family protein [Simiduia agarivorans]|uniref:Lipoprotein NlpD n=1 Tax=Simiduia agarivorans (strain DSM 21679 / JCM 13881 / BCRC 17597 / SA1) TaxID=1117647 RepID=K4KJL2_SIMAS|nr:peptidoglycan DD-metalloendopeptidase family protein [Simiduia agarivorans]AFU98188.1 lipoprotein NlpD [Simiduia agarivorans SA1 = DSM 21679]
MKAWIERGLLRFYDSRRIGQVGLLLVLLSALISCAGPGGGAPVYERTQAQTRVGAKTHRVQKGETLYSIAFRYGVDYKELSRRNGIGKNYTIYPGQLIYLDVSNTPVTNKSQPVAKQPAAKSRTQVAKKPVSEPAKPAARTVQFTDFRWTWPANGRILRAYSPKSGLNKGIDIEGRLGEPVLSAAPGTVVYAGDGLRGYGRLVIIKHNDQFLSAYAHNSKLLVKEGEVIKGNQKIAEIGSSGTDTTKLHFEIRREGEPVDPLLYLPKR